MSSIISWLQSVTSTLKCSTRFMSLQLSLMLVVCGGFGPLFSDPWNMYLSIHADDSYQEALILVDQFEKALVNDVKRKITACVDIFVKNELHRIEFFKGAKTVYPSFSVTDRLVAMKNACHTVFSNAQCRTLIIFSGHGTGIIEPTFNRQLQRWTYEPDSGSSPCSTYCADRYALFSQQIEYIMEGKSLTLTKGAPTYLKIGELQKVLAYSAELLERKIDIIGFDTCYNAQIEIAYALQDYGHILVASQECEDKDGWNYEEVVKALVAEQGPEQTARQLVFGYDRVQRIRQLDRYSLSVFELGRVPQVIRALDAFVQFVIPLLTKNEDVMRAACAARVEQHKMCGLHFYADLADFLEKFLVELNARRCTGEIDHLKSIIIQLRECLNALIIASVSGPLCIGLHGCSIYFPLAHVDSAYTGAFAIQERWSTFLYYFTGGQDTTESLVTSVEA